MFSGCRNPHNRDQGLGTLRHLRHFSKSEWRMFLFFLLPHDLELTTTASSMSTKGHSQYWQSHSTKSVSSSILCVLTIQSKFLIIAEPSSWLLNLCEALRQENKVLRISLVLSCKVLWHGSFLEEGEPCLFPPCCIVHQQPSNLNLHKHVCSLVIDSLMKQSKQESNLFRSRLTITLTTVQVAPQVALL